MTWSIAGCSVSACGSVNSSGLYTAPALIPSSTTITVVATLQSDTSKTGSATVTHVPVKVEIAETSVDVTATQTHQFTATVTGHTNTAVTWSMSGCTGESCGTLSESGLYTAPGVIPDAQALTVTATSTADGTKSDVVTVHERPLTIDIAETAVSLSAGGTHQFTAGITGHPDTAVDWSVSCDGAECGTITAAGLYSAPATITSEMTVTVKATAHCDHTKWDTASVQLTVPVLSVRITPSTNQSIGVGTEVNFTAEVQNDPNNAGVTWSLGAGCTAACGPLSNITSTSATFTAPATVPNPATVPLTATSVTDSAKSASVVMTITPGPLLKPGNYAFVFNGYEIVWRQNWFMEWYATAVRTAYIGHFYADANGTISGVQDVRGNSGVSLSQAFTGTYTVGADLQGTLTIGSGNYLMTVDGSGTKGTFIRYDTPVPHAPTNGTGYFERQDTSEFALANLAGEHVIGVVNPATLAVMARFSANAAGTITNGVADALDPTASYESLTLTGSIEAPAADTGRGIATLHLSPAPGPNPGDLSFVYYVIGDGKALLMTSDASGPLLTGELLKQVGAYSAASFNAPSVFQLAGSAASNTLAAAVGLMSPDGSSAMTGVIDENHAATVTIDQAFTGTFTIAGSGRSAMALQVGGQARNAIAYFYDQNKALLMQTTGSEMMYGRLQQQTGGPFSTASIAGTFRANSEGPVRAYSENDNGLTTLGATGSIHVLNDFNYFDGSLNNQLGHNDWSGTYAMAANGRGTFSVNSMPLVFWAVSPTEMVGVSTLSTMDSLPILSDYRK